MALGETGISVTAVRNESVQGNRNFISGLTTSGQVNPYSFWSPRGIIFDSNNNYILTPVTDVSPYQIGDFRRYNHAADLPHFEMTSQQRSFDPGSSQNTVPVWYRNEELNFKRADASSQITKFGLRYYTTLADAKADSIPNAVILTSGSSLYTQTITYGNNIIRDSLTPSPALSGHVVNQTESIQGSTFIMPALAPGNGGSANGFYPTTGLTTSYVWRFAKPYMLNITNDVRGSLANYVSGAGATNSGTLITVATTKGLFPGMALEVTAGSGSFPTGAYVATVNSSTQFTASASPGTLAAGAVITAYHIFPFQLRIQSLATVQLLGGSNGSYTPNPLKYDGFSTTPSSCTPGGSCVTSTTGPIAICFTNNVTTCGQANWNFSFRVYGIFGSDYRQLAGSVQLKYENPSSPGTYTNIGGVRNFSFGSTISVNDAVSGTISSLACDTNYIIVGDWTITGINTTATSFANACL